MLQLSYNIQKLASLHSQLMFPLKVWRELESSSHLSLDLSPPFVFHCLSWVYLKYSILGLYRFDYISGGRWELQWGSVQSRWMSRTSSILSSKLIPPLGLTFSPGGQGSVAVLTLYSLKHTDLFKSMVCGVPKLSSHWSLPCGKPMSHWGERWKCLE